MRVESHQKSNQSSWHFAGADSDAIASLKQELVKAKYKFEFMEKQWQERMAQMKAQMEAQMEEQWHAKATEVVNLQTELNLERRKSAHTERIMAALDRHEIADSLQIFTDGSKSITTSSGMSADSDVATAQAQAEISEIYSEMAVWLNNVISNRGVVDDILKPVEMIAQAVVIAAKLVKTDQSVDHSIESAKKQSHEHPKSDGSHGTDSRHDSKSPDSNATTAAYHMGDK